MIGSKHFQMGLAVSLLALMPQAAQAQTVEQLQAQIDELKAQVQSLMTALGANKNQAAPVVAQVPPQSAAPTTTPAPASIVLASAPAPTPAAKAGKSKAWYDRLTLRGYTQMRYNGFLSGDDNERIFAVPEYVVRLRC